jgi:hypothetical protein
MKSKKEIENLKKDLSKKFVIDSMMQKGNITKEELKPFESNFDFIQLTKKFKEILGKKDSKEKSRPPTPVELESKPVVDWTLQLAVINYLRRLFKYERAIFNQTFYGLQIYENVIEFFNSIRSILAQNAIILMNEIFSEFIPETDEKNQKAPVINLIKAIIPVLISKANTSQSFIKNEAKACLETLVNNMKYNDTLITLLQSMNSKKIVDLELAYILTIKLVKNLGNEFLSKSNSFSTFLKEIINICESNSNDLYKKKCKGILNLMVELMTRKEFDKKIENCGKKEKEKIKEILDGKIQHPQPNTKKDIIKHPLKSNDKSKSNDKKKGTIYSKPVLKKQINIKLVDNKNTKNEKTDNVVNNAENINNNVAQICK